MIIIMEGLDQTGKSTIAKMILEKYGGCLVKIKRPENNSMFKKKILRSYYDYTHLALDNRDMNFIFDRYYISEMVYSLPKRGYDAIEDDSWKQFSESLWDENPIIFYFINTNDNDIKKRIEDTGETFIKFDERKLLHERYETAMERFGLEYHRIDTTNLDKETVLNRCLEILWNKGYEY